ncbi:MAG TPA: signal peptidase I [Planctomycetaceae bacterium]|nr:signal peptidase I [Planctomycetaceae bacterium]HIQ21559.1 signal peptidase I [Planctomycetota bacterium]
MAPTLMGRHKELTCPECGFPFQVSASVEVDSRTNRANGPRVTGATCPNCRFPVDLDQGNPWGKTYRSYKGDRILVGKFPYEFGEPKRWDVAVFKFPGGAETNYIKRVIGLPGERIRIFGGDIYVQGDGAGWSIARKPPRKMRAMLQVVHDARFVSRRLRDAGWPPRWSPGPSEGGEGWTPSADSRFFTSKGTEGGEAWVGYRHLVPTHADWLRIQRGDLPPGFRPRPQLITDLIGYNTGIAGHSPLGVSGRDYFRRVGVHWVGDLALEADVEVEGPGGAMMLELAEGDRRFRCRIDVATGEAALSISGPGMEAYHPRAVTPLRGPGRHHVCFANVDDRLTLWIDGRVVDFDTTTDYPPLGNNLPTDLDLQPARIGTQGARLRVGNLRVLRDIYYIAEKFDGTMLDNDTNGFGVIADYDERTWAALKLRWRERGESPEELLRRPAAWRQIAAGRRAVEFQVPADRFLVLGDNSAESQDSRLWVTKRMANGERPGHFVRRELLIGKALVIYWPHSLDRIPYLEIPIRFFPNFKRMGIVR